MAREVTHIQVSSSWWNATITTACGITVNRSETSSVWFPSLSGNRKCPACLANAQAKGTRS